MINRDYLTDKALSNGRHPIRAGKYLTFALGGEGYGIAIGSVREIIGVMEITRLPQTPLYLNGVINLRGKVIPVVDLRLKLGMEQVNHTRETCVIVVDIGEAGTGLIVDTVAEVVDITSEQIDPPPAFGQGADTDCILGMGKIKGRVHILLDIGKTLNFSMSALTPAMVE